MTYGDLLFVQTVNATQRKPHGFPLVKAATFVFSCRRVVQAQIHTILCPATINKMLQRHHTLGHDGPFVLTTTSCIYMIIKSVRVSKVLEPVTASTLRVQCVLLVSFSSPHMSFSDLRDHLAGFLQCLCFPPPPKPTKKKNNKQTEGRLRNFSMASPAYEDLERVLPAACRPPPCGAGPCPPTRSADR